METRENFLECYCLRGTLYMNLPALCNQMVELIAFAKLFAKVFAQITEVIAIYVQL